MGGVDGGCEASVGGTGCPDEPCLVELDVFVLPCVVGNADLSGEMA